MAKGGRRTQIMGTKGEIVGDMTTFTVTDFRSGKQRIWDAKVEEVIGSVLSFNAGFSGMIRSSAWKPGYQLGLKIAVDLFL